MATNDPLVTGVLAYLWKNQRDEWSQSILTHKDEALKDNRGHYWNLQRISYCFYLFKEDTLLQRMWFIGEHFIFPGNLSYPWLLFVQNQFDRITQCHPTRHPAQNFLKKNQSLSKYLSWARRFDLWDVILCCWSVCWEEKFQKKMTSQTQSKQ